MSNTAHNPTAPVQASRTIINVDNVPSKYKEAMQQEARDNITIEDDTLHLVEKYGPHVVAKIYKQEFMAIYGNYPERYLEDLPTQVDTDEPKLTALHAVTSVDPSTTENVQRDSALNTATTTSRPSPLTSLLTEARRLPPSPSFSRSPASAMPSFGNFSPESRITRSDTTRSSESEGGKKKEIKDFFRNC